MTDNTEPPFVGDPNLYITEAHLTEYSLELGREITAFVEGKLADLKKEIMDSLNVKMLIFDKDGKPVGVRPASLPAND